MESYFVYITLKARYFIRGDYLDSIHSANDIHANDVSLDEIKISVDLDKRPTSIHSNIVHVTIKYVSINKVTDVNKEDILDKFTSSLKLPENVIVDKIEISLTE